MGKDTNIEWCRHTFNAWRGCTKVSPGCEHCYAETLSFRNPKVLGQWGKGKPRVLASEAMWKEPLKWNRDAAADWENWTTAVSAAAGDSGAMPERPRVFCASLADWLDDEVPIEWLAQLLQLIHKTPNLDWLMLMKRPQNWCARILQVEKMARQSYCGEPRTTPVFDWNDICSFYEWITDWTTSNVIPENIWIGTTVEDQTRADERIPQLLSIPAKVRFLSCEPLLGPVDITTPLLTAKYKACEGRTADILSGSMPEFPWLDWLICGGESGAGARPMHPDWARSLRDQCSAAGVPFFFKQWGEYENAPANECRYLSTNHLPLVSSDLETAFYRVGKKKAGRLLDGRTHDEFPKVERGTGA